VCRSIAVAFCNTAHLAPTKPCRLAWAPRDGASTHANAFLNQTLDIPRWIGPPFAFFA
jgi:hypothetical protein